MPLKNNGAIRLTISKYYLPSGKSISGTGITPDIEVEENSDEFRIGTETDNQLDFAAKLLNGKNKNKTITEVIEIKISFSEAFKTAKNNGLDTFIWKDNNYSTITEKEFKDKGYNSLKEYLDKK